MGGWRYVILWGSILKYVTDLTDPTKVFFAHAPYYYPATFLIFYLLY